MQATELGADTMNVPLYERLRPKSFDDVVGQQHLVGKDGIIRKLALQKKPYSFLLFGPPGCGKTTVARLYADALGIPFFSISGADGQIAGAKKIVKDIVDQPLVYPHAILFVDEIHRINKSGQDFFLPYLEKGTISLVAATTENPSFVVNNALLSRMQVFEIHPLQQTDLASLITRFLKQETKIQLTKDAIETLLHFADGDARFLLNSLESLTLYFSGLVDSSHVEQAAQKKRPAYDKAGEGHYNLISALHKAVRASDPDAALYWFARMVHGGEDLNFIARRIIRMASEDIGLADKEALNICINASIAFERLGKPEGELAIAQAILHLALAPKSNATYTAYEKALIFAKKHSQEAPPKHALNSPTKLMKQMQYGKGYIYDHDTEHGCSGLSYFPEEIEERPRFYKPKERGEERDVKKRHEFYARLRLIQQTPEDIQSSQHERVSNRD